MKPSIETCYKLLDVLPECTAEDLKRAHKDLVQVWHPDRFGSNKELQQKALNKIQEINSAYDQILEFRSNKAKDLIKNKSSGQESSSRTYAMEGRDSIRLAPPLVPLKYRIFMLLGFGTFLVILLVLISQRIFETGHGKRDLTAIENKSKNLEIRDETYLVRQQLVSRLEIRLDAYLKKIAGKQNYSTNIRMEVDTESKMILQTIIMVKLNSKNIPQAKTGVVETTISNLSCQKNSLEELKTTIFRIARLVPARGDRVEVTCVLFN